MNVKACQSAKHVLNVLVFFSFLLTFALCVSYQTERKQPLNELVRPQQQQQQQQQMEEAPAVEVFDDFVLDCSQWTEEWIREVETSENLTRFTNETKVSMSVSESVSE